MNIWEWNIYIYIFCTLASYFSLFGQLLASNYAIGVFLFEIKLPFRWWRISWLGNCAASPWNRLLGARTKCTEFFFFGGRQTISCVALRQQLQQRESRNVRNIYLEEFFVLNLPRIRKVVTMKKYNNLALSCSKRNNFFGVQKIVFVFAQLWSFRILNWMEFLQMKLHPNANPTGYMYPNVNSV